MQIKILVTKQCVPYDATHDVLRNANAFVETKSKNFFPRARDGGIFSKTHEATFGMIKAIYVLIKVVVIQVNTLQTYKVCIFLCKLYLNTMDCFKHQIIKNL